MTIDGLARGFETDLMRSSATQTQLSLELSRVGRLE